MTTLTLAEAMLSAVTNGISIIPLRANKRPGVPEWKPYISQIAGLDEVHSWAKHFDGFAILCGTEARLEVFDFEEIFCLDYWGQFLEALADEELYATFDSWLRGYCVTTPSGGLHVAVHLMGEGETPGNLKLAMDMDGKTLAETRGHGGYVVAAPSGGSIHPSGLSWLQHKGGFGEIEWATPEEWEAVCRVIASLGVPTPVREPTAQAPGSVSLAQLERSGSWIDAVTKPLMRSVLADHGWQFHHDDADHAYWTRPGKDPREGHSATINAADRLFVFSSSAHPVPPSAGRQTYDVTDIIGCYELGHLPSLDERTEIMRRWKPERVPPSVAEQGRDNSADEIVCLPSDFWQAADWLSQLYDEALAVWRAPEAVLGSVLSTYATVTPMPFKVPAITGTESPLNMFSVAVGRSGKGKSTAMRFAKNLLGISSSPDYLFGQGLRSGEGLVALARHGKDKESYRKGIQVIFDEGSMLEKMSQRLGSTSLAYLTSAWSGLGTVGGAKAGGDDSFPADLVRVCLVIGVQFGVAGSLFTGESLTSGFPGRFLYFGQENPILKEIEVHDRLLDHPEPLRVRRYSHDEAREVGTIAIPGPVIIAVRTWERDDDGRDQIDGHRMLVRLRLACLLALMSGHVYVDDTTWELSGVLETYSRSLRDSLLAALSDSRRQADIARGMSAFIQQETVRNEWIKTRAQKLASWVKGTAPPEGVSRSVLRKRLNASDRKSFDEILDYALSHSLVSKRVEGRASYICSPD